MHKRNSIAGQFAARPIAMLESPAFRVLSRAAHQVLARIEIEHAHHGGNENGHLPSTYQHFVEYGLDRRAIPPAIRELVALGFVEITQRGSGGNADLRQHSLYRLTYRHAKGEPGDGTHEWRRIKTVEQAGALAKAARQEVDRRAREVSMRLRQKQNSGDSFPHVSGVVSNPGRSKSSVGSTPTVPGRFSTPTSISRVNAPTGRDSPIPLSLATSCDGEALVIVDRPKLAWSKPVVRELFGEEARIRRLEARGPV
jgi:hypothetical protein